MQVVFRFTQFNRPDQLLPDAWGRRILHSTYNEQSGINARKASRRAWNRVLNFFLKESLQIQMPFDKLLRDIRRKCQIMTFTVKRFLILSKPLPPTPNEVDHASTY